MKHLNAYFLVGICLWGLSLKALPISNCQTEVEQLVYGLNLFFEPVGQVGERFAFRSLSMQHGEYFDLFEGQVETRLTRVTDELSQSWSWDEDCRESFNEVRRAPVYSDFRKMDSPHLESFLQTEPRLMFYFWKPGWVHSVGGFQLFKRMAEKKGLKFVHGVPAGIHRVQLDTLATTHPEIDEPWAFTSVEFYAREMYIHFPSVLIAIDGVMKKRILFGLMTEEELEERLDDILEEGEEAALGLRI